LAACTGFGGGFFSSFLIASAIGSGLTGSGFFSVGLFSAAFGGSGFFSTGCGSSCGV
jgi:hypothetical protein